MFREHSLHLTVLKFKAAHCTSAWLRLGSALSQEIGRYIRKEYKVLSKMLEYKFPEKNVWVREINVGGESSQKLDI